MTLNLGQMKKPHRKGFHHEPLASDTVAGDAPGTAKDLRQSGGLVQNIRMQARAKFIKYALGQIVAMHESVLRDLDLDLDIVRSC